MSERTPAGAPDTHADTGADTRTGDDLLADLADEFLRRHRAGERPTLDEYCAKHPDLAGRIRDLFPAMLAMEQSEPGAAADVAPPAERVGAMVGRYKLLEWIGEGGFGVVYMAEQQHPVRRKVALKVIKPGMDSRQVLARFDAERQALALMDHEHIARVLDAGATDSGRPYFVMELVRGQPITTFCDARQLAPRQRLELFAQVCHAVQHAHQKGIIHRDLKPSNVLVAVHDTRPVVKVIDFGVAKALGQELTEKTLFTGFAQLLGTPLYMSPEQAGDSSVDVDTRSDIYSLGVLLYELLTGMTPFDKERFRKSAHEEIRRIIREEEPPRPSTRLGQSKDSIASISALRHTEPAKLTRLVRGELDWIVMKALEKDRGRRYQTANGLATDVQRYLADEPVLACPPSAGYRLKKFARRNRRALATATLAGVLLLTGAIGALVYAAEQRRLAKEQKQLFDDRNRFVAEQAESLRRLEGIQQQTQADLYQALLRQSAALREGRQSGYRSQVWANLRRAATLPVSNPDDIRREVLACLGDPVGLAPADAASARRGTAAAIPEQFLPLIPKDRNARAAVAPGGTLLAVSAGQIVLHGEGGQVLGTAERPLGFVYDLEFTADGRRLVAGCEEGVAVWTVPDLRPFTFYRGHNAYSVAAQPGGPMIASTGSWISLWSLRANRQVAALKQPSTDSRVEFSEDGRFLLAVRGEQVLATWHVGGTPEKLELAGHDGGVPTVAFGPGGAVVASAGKDRKVKFWDAHSGALRHVGEGHESAVESIAFSPDGTILASGDYNGMIRFWDPATGREVGRVNAVCGQVWRLQFDPGGRYLAAAGGKGVAAWAIRRSPGAVRAEEFLVVPTTASVYDLAIHPGGAALVWLDSSAKVFAYDLTLARFLPLPVQTRAGLRTLHFDPGGDNLRLAGAGDWLMAVPWAAEGPPARLRAPARFAAPSPDGRWLATTYSTLQRLIVADAELGRAWSGADLPPQSAAIWALSWSADGTRLAAGLADGGLIVWDLEQVRARLAEFGFVVPSTAVRPDVSRPPPLAPGDFEKVVDLHRGTVRDRVLAAQRAVVEREPNNAAAHSGLGDLLGRQNKTDEAIRAFRRALELDPKLAHAYNGLAWQLATCADAKFRDPAQALALAEKAVELNPADRTWQTLGWARYRCGDWKGSIAAQKQSMELQQTPKGGDAGQWFCLALAHWQLGERDEARRWYDRAVEWMEKYAIPGGTLARFRNEAAELLGVKQKE